MTQRGRSPVWRFATLIVLLLGFGAAAALGLTPGPVALAETAHRAGPFTPLVVIAGMSVLLAALVPRTVLGVAAGLLFGAAVGALYVLAAALIGAGIAFGLGRILGREFIAARPQTAAVDRLLRRRGLVAVLTVRLLPVAPFGFVSYALGATGVRTWSYLAGTLIGIIPGTVLFATAGANALTPSSPVFVASTVAAVGLATAAALGARRITRDRSNDAVSSRRIGSSRRGCRSYLLERAIASASSAVSRPSSR